MEELGERDDGLTAFLLTASATFPLVFDSIRIADITLLPSLLIHPLLQTFFLIDPPIHRIHYWADVVSVLKGIVGIDPIITGVPG